MEWVGEGNEKVWREIEVKWIGGDGGGGNVYGEC